jgi:hypothetical protein
MHSLCVIGALATRSLVQTCVQQRGSEFESGGTQQEHFRGEQGCVPGGIDIWT